MWRTRDGVMHTVALPEPRDVFQFEVMVESVQDDLVSHWDGVPLDEDGERAFFAQAVPVGTFDSAVTDEESLAEALRRIEPRWRLDVTSAVEDLADGDLALLPATRRR